MDGSEAASSAWLLSSTLVAEPIRGRPAIKIPVSPKVGR